MEAHRQRGLQAEAYRDYLRVQVAGGGRVMVGGWRARGRRAGGRRAGDARRVAGGGWQVAGGGWRVTRGGWRGDEWGDERGTLKGGARVVVRWVGTPPGRLASRCHQWQASLWGPSPPLRDETAEQRLSAAQFLSEILLPLRDVIAGRTGDKGGC